jgi:hypothetical protein
LVYPLILQALAAQKYIESEYFAASETEAIKTDAW